MSGWKRFERKDSDYARDFGHGPVDKWMDGLGNYRPVRLRRGGSMVNPHAVDTLLRITDGFSNRCVDVTFTLRKIDS